MIVNQQSIHSPYDLFRKCHEKQPVHIRFQKLISDERKLQQLPYERYLYFFGGKGVMVQNVVRYQKNGKQIECYWNVEPMKEPVSSGATPHFYDYSFLFVPVVAVFVNAIVAEDPFVKSHGFTFRFTHFFHRNFVQ
jgi:hypothetical protein